MVSCKIFSPRKQNRQIRCGGGLTNSSWPQQYDTKPSVGIIAHGVGVISWLGRHWAVGDGMGQSRWPPWLRKTCCEWWNRGQKRPHKSREKLDNEYAFVRLNSICHAHFCLISGVRPSLWQSKLFTCEKGLVCCFFLSSLWSHLIAKNCLELSKMSALSFIKSLWSHQGCLLISVISPSFSSFPVSR